MFDYNPHVFTGAETTATGPTQPGLTTPPGTPPSTFFSDNKYYIIGGVAVVGVAAYMLMAKKGDKSISGSDSSVGGYHRDSYAGIQHAARRR
jgi:hypothetical protein